MNGYLNAPEEPDGKAYVSWRDGERWLMCPYCNKKQFPLTPITQIKHLWFKCKNSKCKKEFLIDVTE